MGTANCKWNKEACGFSVVQVGAVFRSTTQRNEDVSHLIVLKMIAPTPGLRVALRAF